MRRFFRSQKFFIIIGIILSIGICIKAQDDCRKYAKFRTMQDSITEYEKVDIKGLEELKIAGGPRLSFAEIKKKLSHIKANKIIVDGSIPRRDLKSKKFSFFMSLIFGNFYTERLEDKSKTISYRTKEAKKYGFEYVAFQIGSKSPSSDSTIDEFVNFFDTLPENAYVYFHCEHGKGRTSIMLVMADIIRNAPKVSLEDIIKRQHLLGSVNLFDVSPWRKGTYHVKMLEERISFIRSFYRFICQRQTGGIQVWSKWKSVNQSKRD